MSKTHPRLSRRVFLAGAATAGAAAAGAAALPGAAAQPQSSAAVPPSAPERGGGYRLSEHVKRYYKTTLV
ncbi:formate dehydrogenase [Bordetella petrii]|uniref:formate dehydrogenase n=1 Tax=Bordetella petrii TaxID=94624 RepID=UPI001A973D41|nr:formate dehydrogenase [Bordetella petrii]MBO1112248.1 formate dehydrogenase [Bordetella petrii]